MANYNDGRMIEAHAPQGYRVVLASRGSGFVIDKVVTTKIIRVTGIFDGARAKVEGEIIYHGDKKPKPFTHRTAETAEDLVKIFKAASFATPPVKTGLFKLLCDITGFRHFKHH